jgi:hypothetical protein
MIRAAHSPFDYFDIRANSNLKILIWISKWSNGPRTALHGAARQRIQVLVTPPLALCEYLLNYTKLTFFSALNIHLVSAGIEKDWIEHKLKKNKNKNVNYCIFSSVHCDFFAHYYFYPLIMYNKYKSYRFLHEYITMQQK